MAKIGVIGDAASAMGFKAFGLDAFPVSSSEEARTVLHRLAKEDYGIIYMTERFCRDLRSDMAEYTGSKTPAIIPIPGVDGNYGIGIAGVKKSVERAVGADILFGGDN